MEKSKAYRQAKGKRIQQYQNTFQQILKELLELGKKRNNDEQGKYK